LFDEIPHVASSAVHACPLVEVPSETALSARLKSSVIFDGALGLAELLADEDGDTLALWDCEAEGDCDALGLRLGLAELLALELGD
jgi:hypothetical protein